MFRYFNVAASNFKTYNNFYALPPSSGTFPEVLALSQSPAAPDMLYSIVENAATQDLRLQILWGPDSIPLGYDQSDGLLKWTDGFQENFTYRFHFTWVTNINNPNTLEVVTLVIWVQTETRRLTWVPNGNTIVPTGSLPPASYMSSNQYGAPTIDDKAQFTFILDTSRFILTNTIALPFYSNLDELDGQFLKFGFSQDGNDIYGLGVCEWTGIEEPVTPCLAITNMYEFNTNYVTSPQWSGLQGLEWTQFQLRRNYNLNTGVPLGTWTIYMGATLGRMCTRSNRSHLVIAEYSSQIGQSVPQHFNWTLEFDVTLKTISICNQDRRDEGRTDCWLTTLQQTSYYSVWASLGEYVDREQFDPQSLFCPIVYEQERYANSDALLVQCCANQVTETGKPAPGYDSNDATINYEIYCPETHLPDSSGTLIKTSSTATCDNFLETWCALPDNESTDVCGCIRADLHAPPLPDDSLISSYLFCFSSPCYTTGYRTSGMIAPGDGALLCPTTLCLNLIDIENNGSDSFIEAKQILNCNDDGTIGEQDDGIDTMTIIYIAIAGIVVLALVIGLAVGIPAGNRKKEEEEEAAQKKKKKRKRKTKAEEE